MAIASILSDLWREGGGGLLKPPTQAQELQKNSGGIGLSEGKLNLCSRFTAVFK